MSLLSKKGFTLIELLVTVGIIVILATLIIVNIAQARMSGRDAKRIADVASIQLALEMYRNVNGQYPEDFPGWAAATEATPATTADCSSSSDKAATYQCLWNKLSTDLTSYLSPLPKDPLNKVGGYRYYVDMKYDRTGAIIKTKLEANLEKMADDSCQGVYNNPDYYDIISGNFPNGIDPDTLTPSSVPQNQCIGNGSTDDTWAYPVD